MTTRHDSLHSLASSQSPTIEQFLLLLRSGAKVDEYRLGFWLPTGWLSPEVTLTPLQVAALNDNADCVQWLLSAGAQPNKTTDSGAMALHLAASEAANPRTVDLLLRRGAGINAKDKDGWTALHYAAAWNRNTAITSTLISWKANVHARDESEQTPLLTALDCSANPEVIEELLIAGSDPDAYRDDGLSAMHLAAATQESFETMVRLLQWHAPMDDADADGRTPLHHAAEKSVDPRTVELLIRHGALLNAKDEEEEWTPLHLAAGFNDNVSITTALLDAGADPNPVDREGMTPMDLAKSAEHRDALATAGGRAAS